VWEANKIGMCLPQLRVSEKFGKDDPESKLSQGAYDWLKARYDNDVGILDQELTDKHFILGNDITPADFSLSAYLMYADEAAVDVPINVEQWLNRLREVKRWQSPYVMMKV
jgi:glutathione S-transferase